MSARRDLGIAYIRKRPESAARVIAAKDPADSAAFLQELPARIAVRALKHMRPGPAARVVAELDAATAAAFLREMPVYQASALLRRLPADQRRETMQQLPRRLRRALETSLAFPPGTVGARMTVAPPTLFETDRPADALSLVGDADEEHTDVVFVLDAQQRFVGAVALSRLLKAPETATLADLADRRCPELSANARLETIAALDAWHDYSRLPVVGRHGELAGTLSRQALRQHRDADDEPGPTDASPGQALSEAMLTCVAGVAELLLPRSTDSDRPGDRHDR